MVLYIEMDTKSNTISSLQEEQNEVSEKKKQERDELDFKAPQEVAPLPLSNDSVLPSAKSSTSSSSELTLDALKEKFSKKGKESKKRKSDADQVTEGDISSFVQQSVVENHKKANKEKKKKEKKEKKSKKE